MLIKAKAGVHHQGKVMWSSTYQATPTLADMYNPVKDVASRVILTAGKRT
jgi:hypothetical protein